MSLNICPICSCDSGVLVTIARYNRCVTSDSEPVDAPVDNVVCGVCRTTLNSSGVRGREAAFYREMYTLLAETDDAEFVYDTSVGRRGINDEIVDFLRQEAELPPRGRLLEIGASKGVFLDRFARTFPRWEIAAVEPSRAALRVLKRRVSQARIHEGSLDTSPFQEEQFDLVVLIGVLEHVPDPVSLLHDVRRCLVEGGVAMIGVPNFENNPTDLLTYDHLTRFTPDSLRATSRRAGLITASWNIGSRVPMWTLVRVGATDVPPAGPDRGRDALEGARNAAAWVADSLAVFDELGRDIDKSRRLAVYGTGAIAIAAVELTSLSRNQIACFVDDNSFLHGGTRLNRPIVSMEDAAERGITDIVFSANPCYLGAMKRNVLKNFENNVRVWPLPEVNMRQEETHGDIFSAPR